jgi:hypothetical protein
MNNAELLYKSGSMKVQTSELGRHLSSSAFVHSTAIAGDFEGGNGQTRNKKIKSDAKVAKRFVTLRIPFTFSLKLKTFQIQMTFERETTARFGCKQIIIIDYWQSICPSTANRT